MWDTDCVYLPNKKVIYTSTAYGEIRMYDRKVKPRPVEDNKLFKNKINRLLTTSCENYLIMGDTFGNIFFLDRRKSNPLNSLYNYNLLYIDLKIVKSLKGNTGAIRDIKIYPGTNIVASCGLDRFLHTYNYKTMEEMPHIYLKNKLTSVHFYECNNEEKLESDSQDEEEEENNDEMFESFEDEDEEEGDDEDEKDK